MSDIFRKTFLAGLGAMSLTREKAQELTNDLIKRGELAKTDEAKFIRDLLDLAEKNKTSLEEKIEKGIEKVLEKLDIPSRKEVNELKAEVEKLTRKSK